MKLVATGYGMPYMDFNQGKKFGDLIVEIDITFPDSMDTSMIPLLKDILEVGKDLKPHDEEEEEI